jgi:hypothetical protein
VLFPVIAKDFPVEIVELGARVPPAKVTSPEPIAFKEEIDKVPASIVVLPE